MNSNTTLTENIKPDISSWTAATVSLGLLLLGCFFLTIQLEELRKKQSYSALSEGESSIIDLYEIEKAQGLARFISDGKRASLLLDLANVSEAIENDNLEAARNKISEWPGSQDVLRMTENLSLLNAESSKLANEKERLFTVSGELQSEFSLLQNEIYLFLGLKTEEAQANKVAFYEKGVLSGLPTIKNIPDDLGDLQSFSAILNSEGGKIALDESRDPAEFFQEKLEEFRDRAFKISLSYSGQEDKIKDLSTQLSKNEARKKAEKSAISRFLNKLALQVSKS